MFKVGNGTKNPKLEKVTLDKPRGRDVAGFYSQDLIFEIFGPKIAKNRVFHLRGYFEFVGRKAPKLFVETSTCNFLLTRVPWGWGGIPCKVWALLTNWLKS